MPTPCPGVLRRHDGDSPICNSQCPDGTSEHYGVALVCLALGELDEAFRWLEQAYRDHSFWLAYWGGVDPRLDVLRGDERLKVLLRRLGLESS